MSYAAVRAQMTTYLAAQQIPGVLQVYEAMPWYIDGTSWEMSENLGSGAVVYLHFADDSESREGGSKVYGLVDVDYDVAVVVLYQFLVPSGPQAQAVSPDSWVHPFDATLQGIKDAIHADPTFGDPTLIALAAQEARTLRVRHDLPRRTAGKIVQWAAIEFQATEVVQA